MKKFVLVVLILVGGIGANVNASQPVCYSSHGGYCKYEGKVSKVYVNKHNQILMCFEQPIPLAEAEVAGYTISQGAAAIFKITENPDFAKMLYSTILAAKSQDRSVIIQMRGVTSGYLTIDRIWFGG